MKSSGSQSRTELRIYPSERELFLQQILERIVALFFYRKEKANVNTL